MHKEWEEACKNADFQYLVDIFHDDFKGNQKFLVDLYVVWRRHGHGSLSFTGDDRRKWLLAIKTGEKFLERLSRAPTVTDSLDVQREHDAFINELAKYLLSAATYTDKLKSGSSGNYDHILWISALLPYFRYTANNKSPWWWFTDWLKVIAPSKHSPKQKESESESETLRNQWRTRMLDPWEKRLASKEGYKTLSSFDPPFHYAFAYEEWIRWDRHSPQTQKFRDCVFKEIPFLKINQEDDRHLSTPSLPRKGYKDRRKKTGLDKIGIFGPLR